MKIRRTRIVSVPRSGHHWLVRCLGMNLPDMVYLERYVDGRKLETTPEANVQKTHDFDLDVEVNPDYHHVILYRNDIDGCIRSWKELPGWEDWDNADMKEWIGRWKKKWLGIRCNATIVTYEEMIEDIESVVRGVLSRMTGKYWGGIVRVEPSRK